MRKLGVLSSVLALVLTASLAHAGSFSFGVKGGAAIPTGDLGDVVNAAPFGGVYADYWMTPEMAFGADIAGDFFKGDAFSPSFPGETFDLKFSVIQFGVHGMYAFPTASSMAPFFQYGVGLYNGSTKVDELNVDDSSTKFGLNGGLGLNFYGSETMKFGVGAEYHYIFLDKDKDFASSASYIRVLARLTFLTSSYTQR
jgi:hypothetical protein